MAKPTAIVCDVFLAYPAPRRQLGIEQYDQLDFFAFFRKKPGNFENGHSLYTIAAQQIRSLGLNLAQFPSVLVELGNMKNPADSGLITTPEGRQKYADAVVRGIAGFLGVQTR